MCVGIAQQTCTYGDVERIDVGCNSGGDIEFRGVKRERKQQGQIDVCER